MAWIEALRQFGITLTVDLTLDRENPLCVGPAAGGLGERVD
jgi:hypothetical protein